MNGDNSPKRYEIEIDPDAENTSHAKVLELIGPARTVLDLGCSSGYLAKVLQERGARVIGVEIDPELAEKASEYTEKVIVGDLDTLDLTRELAGCQFDAVICADVLEHLTRPWRTLEQLRSLLSPNGFLVASIPNITHVSVAIELLKGNFDYRPLGLLDATHLRFFSKRGVIHLFERSGYWVSALERTYVAPHRMEIAQPLTEFSPDLVRYVEAQDEAITYQFVVKAVPFSETAELARMDTELSALRTSHALVEPSIARAELDALASQLRSARTELAARNAEIETLRSERDSARAEVEWARRVLRKWQETFGTDLKDSLQAAIAVVQRLRVGLRRLRQVLRALRRIVQEVVGVILLPREWFEELVQRTYRPRLTAVHQLKPSGIPGHQWQSSGGDPQFRVEPPWPNGWVKLTLKGRATPPAIATLYVERGESLTEFGAQRLGTLTSSGATLELLVSLRRARFVRLDPTLGPGHFTIDEFTLQRVGIWRVALRAAMLYFEQTRQRSAWKLVKSAARILRDSGFAGLKRAGVSFLRYQQGMAPQYSTWIEQHRLDENAMKDLSATLETCDYQPVISVILPVYDPEAALLRRCIDSVRAQLYSRWELCIADDRSTRGDTRPILEAYAAEDPRIKVVLRERNGHIAAASNSALALATGEFIALLDQDDELSADALLQNVLVLNEHREADLIYSDEDKIEEDGRPSMPYFKPDWSPETLLGTMYLGHLCVYRRAIVEEVGGFLEGMQGSQDYDLALRVTERTCHIQHIARVLYHWRITRGSAAGDLDAKPYAHEAAVRALRKALERRGIAGTVERHEQFPHPYIARLTPDVSKKVSIVIPTRDRADLLGRCLDSIFSLTRHPNFDVCIVDNGSQETATFQLFERCQRAQGRRFRVIRQDIPFNFSTLVNAGVAASDGELLLLLNNDTEVIEGSWLEQLAGYAQLPDIGAVGCVLLYPNGAIQHGGVILMEGAVAGHSHAGQPSSDPGHFGRLLTQSNYAAVTAACLMVRREVFVAVGGFRDELAVAFNDVDFCLRLLRHGYRNVCLGQVRLMHHESKSRGYEDSEEKRARFSAESALMRGCWEEILDRDPYYNPNMRSNPPDFLPAIA